MIEEKGARFRALFFGFLCGGECLRESIRYLGLNPTTV